ncbi:MAG: Uma2 family endonuclease [Planctomycetes bacterium]|nr:Uma2 family endonuclease [Planctomycetota bacterium]
MAAANTMHGSALVLIPLYYSGSPDHLMSSILDKPSVRRAALPISVEQYHRLSQEGIIAERTELLRGVIIERMTKSPLHTYVVQMLVKWLEAAIADDRYVRKEEPLSLVDSEPEPDIAVVSGSPVQYRGQHPGRADLVIEVAISTVGLDRDKAEIYAEAGIPEYWVVIPEEQAVEIYRDPTASGYAVSERLSDAEAVLRPSTLPQTSIRLGNLFG